MIITDNKNNNSNNDKDNNYDEIVTEKWTGLLIK